MVPSEEFFLFVEALKNKLADPLPGLSHQLLMAPPYREVPSESWVKAQNPRPAAVLVCLTEKEGQTCLIFTKRRSYPGVHSDQVSFPGGKYETEDGSLRATALRESQEEIGISLNQTQIIGALTPLYIPPSNFLVHPFVAVAIQEAPWRVQEAEVAALLEIPMAYLLRAESRESRHLHLGEQTREVPGFVWHEHFIWGATAMMLSEFLGVVRSCFQGNESPLA